MWLGALSLHRHRSVSGDVSEEMKCETLICNLLLGGFGVRVFTGLAPSLKFTAGLSLLLWKSV